uniref:hypothetical protein n=1 Tax=Atlantibacter hermannii TaxID=565 RepID=UPI0028B176E8|nr:hypothetical protein [Atlantibacter hermannii]
MKINYLRGAMLILAVIIAAQVQALELKSSFGSINAGYANWNNGFENTHRGEVWKATADFGAIFDKGELVMTPTY